MSSSEAFVTLATTDAYALGALVLAQSIRQVGTTRNLVVLISNHLSQLIRKSLETSFDELIVVEELNSNDEEHLELLSRPELGITFTKINCWLLEQYTKCVFLDADCLVLKPIDQLFEREQLSASPDAGWPDCFNSGVFVYKPSKQTFQQLVSFASQQSSSFDGGDQGLLNSFFSDWRTADISRHLPFTYNVTANAFYSYLPAVTRFRNDIHIVHFAGALKPWQLTFNPQNDHLSGNLTGQNDIQRDFLLSWWRTMQNKVWPKIQLINQELNSNDQSNNQQNSNNNSLFGSFNYGNVNDHQNISIGSAAHRRAWESGNIDYFGRDSFQNIEQQLQRNIQTISNQYHPANSTINHHTNQNKTTLKQTNTSQISSTNHQTTIQQNQTNIHQNKTQTSYENQVKPKVENKQQVTQTTSHQNQTHIHQNKPQTIVHQDKLQTTVHQNEIKPKVENKQQVVQATIQQSQTQTTVHQNQPQITVHQNEIKPKVENKQQVVQTTIQQSQPQTTVHQNQVKSKVENKQQITQISHETVVINTTATADEKSSFPLVNQTVTSLKSSSDEKNHLTNSSKTLGEQQQQQASVNLTQTIEKQPVITAIKSSSKDSQSNSSDFNLKSLNENVTPSLSDHQSNWTVKSTILTSYNQGVGQATGPTVVNKTVTTTNATASKQISDSTNPKVSNNSIGNASNTRTVTSKTTTTNNQNRKTK